MSEKNMQDRLERIFTKDEIRRITLSTGKGQATVTVDIHGMTYYEAKRFLSNLIAVFRWGFKLEVVHGHVHGTVLRDMVRSLPWSSKVKGIYAWFWNDGVTELNVGALA